MIQLPQNSLITSILILVALLVFLLAGCTENIETFEHEIQVQAADTGAPISNATVRAEMGVRDFVEVETNSNGIAQLTIDARYLDRWAKVIINADNYQTKSILVELLKEQSETIVQLEPVGTESPAEPPSAENPTPAADAPTEASLSIPITETNNATSDSQTATIASEEIATSRPLVNVPPAARNDYYQARPTMSIKTKQVYRATIQTNKGDIVVSLDAAAAPEHVNNFIFLSKQGFYDGLTFHRVEPDFVIQGGDPLGTGQGGPGYTIPGEFSLTHGEGALAMARLPDEVNSERESSGSQFYITLAPTPFLDSQYSVFGKVEEGMDVVKSIEVGDKIERIIIDDE